MFCVLLLFLDVDPSSARGGASPESGFQLDFTTAAGGVVLIGLITLGGSVVVWMIVRRSTRFRSVDADRPLDLGSLPSDSTGAPELLPMFPPQSVIAAGWVDEESGDAVP